MPEHKSKHLKRLEIINRVMVAQYKSSNIKYIKQKISKNNIEKEVFKKQIELLYHIKNVLFGDEKE